MSSKKTYHHCKYCPQVFCRLTDYRRHTRVHKSKSESPLRAPNQLLSRLSENNGDGVFDFDNVIDYEYNEDFHEDKQDSEKDTYYSDSEMDHELAEQDKNEDLMNQGDIESDSSDSTYVLRDDDMSDSSSDCLLFDDIDDTSSDDERLPYFTPQYVPDNMVPFSDNIFSRSSAFQTSAIFTAQLQLHNLFNRNKGSLKMYDDMIDILNTYMGSHVK